MVGKQFLNFVTENTLPPIKRCLSVYFARRRSTKERNTITENPPQYGSIETGEPERAPLKGPSRPILYNCRLNYTLLDGGSRPLFDEYLEMLIQYGFITMFVPAFPIAPLFALLNNMFELRTDAKKFLRLMRRPIIKREKGIGIWYGILSVVSSLAIRTNACLIAFTSEFLERMNYVFYYSPSHNLDGYVDFSLSYMNVSRFTLNAKDEALLGNSTYCRYRDFREPPTAADPYAYTPVYWHNLAVKFAFVFIFENVAIALCAVISKCIPDIPKNLIIISRHETRVINELVLQSELSDSKDEKTDEPPTQQPPIGFACVDEIKTQRVGFVCAVPSTGLHVCNLPEGKRFSTPREHSYVGIAYPTQLGRKKDIIIFVLGEKSENVLVCIGTRLALPAAYWDFRSVKPLIVKPIMPKISISVPPICQPRLTPMN
ncbi:hypothetical protein ACTXT7_006797 [Hymenolepis weldensis]